MFILANKQTSYLTNRASILNIPYFSALEKTTVHINRAKRSLETALKIEEKINIMPFSGTKVVSELNAWSGIF